MNLRFPKIPKIKLFFAPLKIDFYAKKKLTSFILLIHVIFLLFLFFQVHLIQLFIIIIVFIN